MPYVAIKCPKCAGDLKLDDKLERGYCIHCGTSVNLIDDVKKVKIIGSIKIPGVPELNDLVKFIKNDLEAGRNRTIKFRNNLKRALELDPDNQFLFNLYISQIWNVRMEHGSLYEHLGNVKRFVVPNCIKFIEKHAFKMCASLKELTIPESVVFLDGNIFYNELTVTIRAYRNSEATQYAMSSNTFLHIIDASKDIQNSITSIKSSLSEIILFRNKAYKKIDNYYNVYRKKRKIFVFVSLPILLTLINYPTPFGTPKKIFFNFLVIFIEFIIFATTHKSIKNEPTFKICIKQMKRDFDSLCNNILDQYEVTDYSYHKKIIDCDLRFLEEDARKIKTAKNKLLKINVNQFIRKYLLLK